MARKWFSLSRERTYIRVCIYVKENSFKIIQEFPAIVRRQIIIIIIRKQSPYVYYNSDVTPRKIRNDEIKMESFLHCGAESSHVNLPGKGRRIKDARERERWETALPPL